MVNQNTYSIGKMLALSFVFVVLGKASAASITALIPPLVEKAKYTEDIIQDPLCFVVQMNKDTYRIGETAYIYLVNLLEEKISFKDDSYGLRIEEWVNGTWELKQTLGNPSLTSSLDPVVNLTNKVRVSYALGENLSLGRYRAVSTGEISQNGLTITVEAYKEYEIIEASSPNVIQLEVVTDKYTYHYGDNITITIFSRENNSEVFGNSTGKIYSVFKIIYQRLSGSSWIEYDGPTVKAESLTYFKPEEKLFSLGFFPRLVEDSYLTQGKNRILVEGWVTHNEQTVFVWGYAEFTVE